MIKLEDKFNNYYKQLEEWYGWHNVAKDIDFSDLDVSIDDFAFDDVDIDDKHKLNWYTPSDKYDNDPMDDPLDFAELAVSRTDMWDPFAYLGGPDHFYTKKLVTADDMYAEDDTK